MSILAAATWCLALLASPQQPEPTVVIAGRVVDLRSEGVPVAEVWVRDVADPTKKLRRTMTDAEGYFRLSRVPTAEWYSVYSSKDGYCDGVGYASGASPTTAIEVHDATTVQGQLLGADGKPAAGIVVTAAPAGRALSRRQVQATTDEQGHFQLDRVPLGLSQICAWVPGKGLAELRHRVVGEDRIALSPTEHATTSFLVTVAGLPQEPAPEVVLSWRPYRRGSYVELPPPLQRPMIRNGSWSCDGLPDWRYSVSVTATGWAFAPNEVDVKEGRGPHQLGFVATAIASKGDAAGGVRCPAVVTDAQGKPVAGVTLVLRKSNGGTRATATTDAVGHCTFDSPLAAGTKVIVYSTSDAWVIDQEKVDGLIGSHDRRFLEDHECTVDPDHTLQVRVIPATSVRGRLLRKDGHPAALVSVQLEEERSSAWPNWLSFAYATTDRDGNFVFARLHHSKANVRLLVEGVDGYATSEPFAIATVGQEVKVPDLTITPPASVAGVVTDAAGKPAPGVTVWLRDWDIAAGRQRSGSVTEVVTDRLGRYRFLGVPIGGAYLELVQDEDGHQMRRVVEPFEVEAAEAYVFDISVEN